MHCAVGVVDGFLRIAENESCPRLLTRVVARVGLGEGKPEFQRLDALRHSAGIIQRVACKTAVADHVKASVPLDRKAHLESDFRIEQASDATVGRGCIGGRHRRGRDLHNVFRLELTQFLAPFVRFHGRLGVIH